MKGQPGDCPDLIYKHPDSVRVCSMLWIKMLRNSYKMKELSEINVYVEVLIGNSITADVIEYDGDRILLNTVYITPGIFLDMAN